MKELSVYVFLVLMFSLFTSYSSAENFPKNDPVPEGVMYRGINEEQWKTIEKIGDPLNCRKRLYDFQQKKNYKVIGPEDCKENKNCIQSALAKNKHVKLKAGIYNIMNPIRIYKDEVLVGDSNGKTLIDAKLITSKESIILKSGIISNIQLENAFDNGIYISNKSYGSLVYRIKVGNSGTRNELSRAGKGINIWGNQNQDHCIISAELYNGYNNTSSNKNKKIREKGGNADGIDIKDGPSNITIIDVHSHHNSDDGFDFFSAGNKKIWDELGKTKTEPIIRVFYSSALFNGKHPYKKNGDGEGFKLGGSSNRQVVIKKNYGARLLYGSAACFNKTLGISRNNSTAKIISIGNNSKSNSKKNFNEVRNKKVKDDKNLLKCSMFKK